MASICVNLRTTGSATLKHPKGKAVFIYQKPITKMNA